MSAIQNNDGILTVTPPSDLAGAEVEALRSELAALAATGVKNISFDLAKVKKIDSLGLAFLIAAANSMSASGSKLVISNASADIAGLLNITRLNTYMDVQAA